MVCDLAVLFCRPGDARVSAAFILLARARGDAMQTLIKFSLPCSQRLREDVEAGVLLSDQQLNWVSASPTGCVLFSRLLVFPC